MDINVDQSGRAEPHQQTADQVLSSLDTDADVGLTSAEARSRLDRCPACNKVDPVDPNDVPAMPSGFKPDLRLWSPWPDSNRRHTA